MNKVMLIGRLTKDPDIRYTSGGDSRCVARFSLAVDRRFSREGEAGTDFISCVAFGKTAELAEKYLKKGMKTALSGRIQTGSYTNREGKKVFTTDIVAEELEFMESRSETASSGGYTPAPAPAYDGDGFIPVDDSGLPFM